MDSFNGDSLDDSLIVLLPSLDGEDSFSDGILIFGIADDDDGTDAVVDAVIADAAEPTVVVAAANGAESPASHDDSAESEPLDLEAKPLLHVVILHDVDLVGDLRLLQRPRQIGGFRGGERVEIVLQLLLIVGGRRRGRGGGGGYIIGVAVEVGRGNGEVDRAPVGAEEDGGGADVEEDDGVAGSDVVVDGPAYSVSRLVGEIDGDADLAAGAGGRGGSGPHAGGMVTWRSRVVDSDGWELRVGF